MLRAQEKLLALRGTVLWEDVRKGLTSKGCTDPLRMARKDHCAFEL